MGSAPLVTFTMRFDKKTSKPGYYDIVLARKVRGLQADSPERSFRLRHTEVGGYAMVDGVNPLADLREPSAPQAQPTADAPSQPQRAVTLSDGALFESHNAPRF